MTRDDFSHERDVQEFVWWFGDTGGRQITPRLKLSFGGRIVGHEHPNESAWRVRAGHVEFVDPSGNATTRFDTEVLDESGRRVLMGPFIPSNGSVFHVLIEFGRAPVRRRSPTVLIVPIHPPYFAYGINLLYQNIGGDADLLFVFTNDAERSAFASMHQPADSLMYSSVVLTHHFASDALEIMAARYTWPTAKKLLALAIAHPHYEHAICVDAETFVLKPALWGRAARETIARRTWHGGVLQPWMEGESKILQASGTELPPAADRGAIEAASQGFGIYSWWWDLPVYDCSHVPGFLEWIGWKKDAECVQRFGWFTFDHLVYQYYTAVHCGFEMKKVEAVVHSLEFARTAVVEAVCREVGPVSWVNALAYAENPAFYLETNCVALYHLDRKAFPQYTRGAPF